MIDDQARAVIDRLRGYVIPLTMPLTDDGGLDLTGLAANARRAIELPGSTGVYFGSVYQEFWTLSMEERKQALAVVVDAVAGEVPVIAGVSSTGAAYSLELAEHAERIGVDMLMAWPAIFGDRDDDGVYGYYRELTDAVDTPVCVYSSTLSELGFYMTPKLLGRVAALPHVCAVKEASFSITTYLALLRELGGSIAVSTPFEEYWLAGLALAPQGAVDFLMGSSRALYMQTPARPLMARCLELAWEGHLAEAYASLDDVKLLVDQIQMRYLGSGRHPIALVKYVTGLLGWAAGPVRPPIPVAADEDRRVAAAALAAAGLVDAPALA
jgi:4-hydroxy-tetrahydrodipicolinate synthase